MLNLKSYIKQRVQASADKIGGKELWRKVETLEDAGCLIASWLRQELLYQPWDLSLIPYPETLKAQGFAESMAKVNDLGVLTLCSQPGFTRQREFVEIVMKDEILSSIQTFVDAMGVKIALAPERPFPFKEAIPVTLKLSGKPYTRLGMSRKDVADLVGHGSRRLKSDIKNGEYTVLSIYDDQFGRRGRVQKVLDMIAGPKP